MSLRADARSLGQYDHIILFTIGPSIYAGDGKFFLKFQLWLSHKRNSWDQAPLFCPRRQLHPLDRESLCHKLPFNQGLLNSFKGDQGMHILLGILGVVGVVVFWVWRMRNAAAAARDLVEVADDVRAAVRRFGYRRKANQNPLDGIEDPRLAAAGILAAFANMDGALSREEIAAIQSACKQAFACDSGDAEQVTAYGRWLVQQSAGNMDEVIRRLARNLVGKLKAEEKLELLAMVEEVARVDGGDISDAQRDTFERLERQLG